MMAVAICAVVTVAATGDKIGRFDTVFADRIYVKNGIEARTVYTNNDAGDRVVILDANDAGDGFVWTKSAKGEYLIALNSTQMGGTVRTYQRNGKRLVDLSTTENGGMIEVTNKTGEGIVQMYADEYGNGVVGSWNRKGEGRTLQPGP